MPTKQPPRDQRSVREQKRDAYTVVLENIRSDFKAFGEALKLNREVANKRFDRIETQLKRLDRIESRLIRVEEKVDQNTRNIAEIKAEISKIRQLLTQKVNREEFRALERRVDLLEQKIVAR